MPKRNGSFFLGGILKMFERLFFRCFAFLEHFEFSIFLFFLGLSISVFSLLEQKRISFGTEEKEAHQS